MAQSSEGVPRDQQGKQLVEHLRRTYAEIADEVVPTETEGMEAVQTLAVALDRVASVVEAAGRDEAVRRHLIAAAGYLGAPASAFVSEMASPGQEPAPTESAS